MSAGDWFSGEPNVSIRRTPLPSEGRARKFVSGLRYWRTELSKERFDIFEGLNLPLVKAPTGQTLLTIHDIRGTRSESNIVERTAYKVFLERSLKSADHVITVSEAMRREILNAFPYLTISVIYNGIDAQNIYDISDVEQHTVRRSTICLKSSSLQLGTLIGTKLLTLSGRNSRLRDQGRSCNLLIAGNERSESKKAIEKRINGADLSGSIRILNNLSDFEVRCIYKLCNLFVFPSSYEGFGIPILEAMAAGRPMVLSDIPVFREITENRGIYTPHNDDQAMARAIGKFSHQTTNVNA